MKGPVLGRFRYPFSPTQHRMCMNFCNSPSAYMLIWLDAVHHLPAGISNAYIPFVLQFSASHVHEINVVLP